MNAYGQYGSGVAPQVARGSAGLAKAAIAVFGLRIAMSLLSIVISPVVVRSVIKSGGSMRGVRAFYEVQHGVFTLVVLAGAILFMLYVRSEIIALRASGLMTKFTPGWSIGWWFVPFANFVMPLLVVLDVWKLRLPRAGGAVPVLWWCVYVLSMITTNIPLPVPYLSLIVAFAAFGLWIAVIFMLMTAPATAPYVQQQQPYYPQQPPAPQPYGYYPPQ